MVQRTLHVLAAQTLVLLLACRDRFPSVIWSSTPSSSFVGFHGFGTRVRSAVGLWVERSFVRLGRCKLVGRAQLSWLWLLGRALPGAHFPG